MLKIQLYDLLQIFNFAHGHTSRKLVTSANDSTNHKTTYTRLVITPLRSQLESRLMGLSSIDDTLNPNLCHENENHEGWRALKFGISTLHAALDCQERKITIKRKANDWNNSKKQHIDTSAFSFA